MLQIILKERTAHLASHTFFTRNVDQYKNTSFHSCGIHHFSQNSYHYVLSSCEYCKVFKNSFFIERLRSSRLQMFFKIGVFKSFANFTGDFCVRAFSKKICSLKACNFIKKSSNTGVFLWSLQNFQEHLFLQITSDDHFCTSGGCYCIFFKK